MYDAEEALSTGSAPEYASQHYCRGALQQGLVPLVLESLAKQDEGDDEVRVVIHVRRYLAKSHGLLPQSSLSGSTTHCSALSRCPSFALMVALQDEWTVSKAAAVCLCFLAECCGDDVFQLCLPFIQTNLSNPDWRYRDASVSSDSL